MKYMKEQVRGEGLRELSLLGGLQELPTHLSVANTCVCLVLLTCWLRSPCWDPEVKKCRRSWMKYTGENMFHLFHRAAVIWVLASHSSELDEIRQLA